MRFEVRIARTGINAGIDDVSGTLPQSLELTHLSLKTKDLRHLDLPRFSSHLQSICLRQNLISKLSPQDIGSLSKLTELDLYDNALEKTYGEVLVQGCPELLTLDYSFNSIRHISHLAQLSKLKTLYFVQNKIAKVREGDFDGPIAGSLTSLELGGNKLRKIEGLERLTRLEELWLGKNKIERLEVSSKARARKELQQKHLLGKQRT